MAVVERRYRVLAVRSDGREHEYQSYPTLAEAQRVADALSRVACPARVAGPEELALDRSEVAPQ